MKIALFSDIHANLPALKAFFKDVDTRNIDVIYCLGDLVGYHIRPNEVIDEIQKRKIPTIAGNHDLKPPDFAQLEEEALSATGKDYAYHIINAKNREYLSTLPAHLQLQFQFNGAQLNVFLTHGSPRKVDEYVLIDTDEKVVLELMDGVKADILCVAHSHKPYHRIIKAASGAVKHVINTGSVGKPKDGDARGGYIMLTINSDTTEIGKDRIKVEFRRFSYDIEVAMQEILDSPLPNELAEHLLSAN